jgi:hypothetical protein
MTEDERPIAGNRTAADFLESYTAMGPRLFATEPISPGTIRACEKVAGLYNRLCAEMRAVMHREPDIEKSFPDILPIIEAFSAGLAEDPEAREVWRCADRAARATLGLPSWDEGGAGTS